jgi:hypothetical protein
VTNAQVKEQAAQNTQYLFQFHRLYLFFEIQNPFDVIGFTIWFFACAIGLVYCYLTPGLITSTYSIDFHLQLFYLFMVCLLLHVWKFSFLLLDPIVLFSRVLPAWPDVRVCWIPFPDCAAALYEKTHSVFTMPIILTL